MNESGCWVGFIGQQEIGQNVVVTFFDGEGRPIHVPGTVASTETGIGFEVRFGKMIGDGGISFPGWLLDHGLPDAVVLRLVAKRP